MQKSNSSQLHDNDEHFMRRALELAAQAIGRTSPNPLVGCVIVKNGKIVGEGYHHKAGTPHAEVHALKEANDKAIGSTVYVTLEPCSHHGRTPPCADALIKANIKRVVVAMKDPNPLVSGRGIDRLREAGIKVDVGLLAEEASIMNEVFCKAITTQYPFVVYKTAMTIDGKIATETGDSRWVSNEESRQYVHQLRDRYDVILVGSETVLHDDPSLTCRYPGGKDPVRLIVDGTLRLPESSKVLSSSNVSPCIIATTQAAPVTKLQFFRNLAQVEVWQYDTPRHVPLRTLLKDLVQRGWTSILLEGGGGLAGAFIQEQLVDKFECFISPKFVGGNGPSPLSGLHVKHMSEAIKLNNIHVDMFSEDIHVTGYLRHGNLID